MSEALQEVLGPVSLIILGLLLAGSKRFENSGGADVL
jgi:hypothetical protein